MDDLHERLQEMRKLEDQVIRLRRIIEDRQVEARRAAERARQTSDEELKRRWRTEDDRRMEARAAEDRQLETTRRHYDAGKDVQKAKEFVTGYHSKLETEFGDLQQSLLEPHSPGYKADKTEKSERTQWGGHLDPRPMKQVLDEAFQTVDATVGHGDSRRPPIYLRVSSPTDRKDWFEAKEKFVQEQRDFHEKVRQFDDLSQHPEVRKFLEKIQPDAKQAEGDALRRRETEYFKKDILDFYGPGTHQGSSSYPINKYASGDWGVQMDVSAGAIAAERKAAAITNFERLPPATQRNIQDLVTQRSKDLDALKSMRDRLTTQLEAAKERVANRGLISRAYYSIAEDKDAALIKNLEARIEKLRNVDPDAESRLDQRRKLDLMAGGLSSGALDWKSNKPEKDGNRWYIHNPALNQKVAELKNEASQSRTKADDLARRADANEQEARRLDEENSSRLNNRIETMLSERSPSPDSLAADARRFEEVEAKADQLRADAAEFRRQVPQLREHAEDLETRSAELLHENRGKGAHLVSDVTSSLAPKADQEQAAERVAQYRATRGQAQGQATIQSERTVAGGDERTGPDRQQPRDPKEGLSQVERNRRLMEERQQQQQAQRNQGRG